MAAADLRVSAKFMVALILTTAVTFSSISLISAASASPTVKIFAKVPDSDNLQFLETNSQTATASEVVLECSAPYPIQWTLKGDKYDESESDPVNNDRPHPRLPLKNVTVTYYASAPTQRQAHRQGQKVNVVDGAGEYLAIITGLHLHEVNSGPGRYVCEPVDPIPTRFVRDTRTQSEALRQGALRLDETPLSLAVAIVGKEEITLPGLDELVVRPKNEVQLGEELHVQCRQATVTGGGRQSFRWWIETRDDGVEPKIDDSTRTHTKTQTELPCSTADCKLLIADLNLASIHCSLKGQGSDSSLQHQKSQAALEIHVKGPSDPPHIKLAFVRDNQDFEQIGNGDGDFEDVVIGEGHGQGHRQARASTYYNKTFKGYRFTAPDFGKNGQTLYVQCRAPYPIEWTYSGYFAPEIMSTTQRYVPQLDPDHLSNHNTYYFITEVIIRTFKSGYTGEYACRKIADYKVKAGVYLYFADPTALFLPTPSETTFIQYANAAASANTNANANSNPAAARRRFFVQCPVSDPLQPISIWKKDEGTEAETWTKWRASRNQLRFNPKFGFEVHPEPNLAVVGTYACRNARARARGGGAGGQDEQASQPTIVSSRLEPAPAPAPLSGLPSPSTASFSVTPHQARVALDPPRVQVLVCESHEEVTLRFSDPALRSTLVISRNATGNTNFKYSALAIIETFKRRPDSAATIECLAVARPQTVVHRWLLTSKAPGQITKFTYVKANETGVTGAGSYVCCGSGYLKPQITVVGAGCHSVTECRFQACLKNPKCARAGSRMKPVEIDVEDSSGPACTEMKIDDVPEEGMLLCDLGVGDVPYLSFSYLLFHRNRVQDRETSQAGSDLPSMAPSEIHTRFWNLNTDVIRGEGGGGLGVEVPGLLKIRRARSMRDGTEKFVCEGSRFFFSLGFYWILERDGAVDGGSSKPDLEYLTGADKMSSGGGGGGIGSSSAFTSMSTYKSTLYLQPEQLTGVSRIRCVAPEWNSFRWRENSMQI